MYRGILEGPPPQGCIQGIKDNFDRTAGYVAWTFAISGIIALLLLFV